MATKQEWTQISNLVGEIHFAVSGGKDATKPDYVPATSGFVIRVMYANETEKTKAALNSTRIAVQNVMRTFYRKNKRFPFAPGKVQVVNGEGEFTLPVSSQVDRLEAALKAGQVDIAEKIRVAEMFGLEVPQEWRKQLTKPQTVSDDERSEEVDENFKYPEGSLDHTTIAKLKIIAQNEELEGYDELTADEIRSELYLIEK